MPDNITYRVIYSQHLNTIDRKKRNVYVKDMKLREYLDIHKMQIQQLADHLGYSREHLSNIVNQNRIPSAQMAKEIEAFTNGQVTRLHLLYPEEFN